MKKLLEILDSLGPAGRKAQGATPSDEAPTTGIPSSESDRIDAVIDPSTISELAALGGKEDFLEKLIRIFLQSGEQKIDSIEKAMRSQNFGLVADLAHALKGSAGQIGAVTMQKICHFLSRAGSTELRKDGNKTVKDLKGEFERVRSALTRYLQQNKDLDTPVGEGGAPGGTSGVSFPPHSSHSR